jgi:septum formation protein
MRLVLASQSPRRRELLEGLGLAPEVRPAQADETPLPGERAEDYVRRLALEKARLVARSEGGAAIIAADTAVVLDGAILGKPIDDGDARRMLRALGGRGHQVLTGVCVSRGGSPPAELTQVVASEVHFVPLADAEIDWYLATGEPRDKAGAYAIQGRGGAWIRTVAGSVSNIIGLPLVETLELLTRVGFQLPWGRR